MGASDRSRCKRVEVLTVSRVRSSSGDIFGRGDFSLGVNMGSNSIPQKTPSDESINRGLVCVYMHFIARIQKILTFMSWTGECRQQKNTQHAPSTKTECDFLNGWIKKRSHTQKSHPKVVNPRDIAGERKKKKKKKKKKRKEVLYRVPSIKTENKLTNIQKMTCESQRLV